MTTEKPSEIPESAGRIDWPTRNDEDNSNAQNYVYFTDVHTMVYYTVDEDGDVTEEIFLLEDGF